MNTSTSTPTEQSSGYFAAGADYGSERTRLRLLEARSDPVSFQRLRAVGVTSGWRCLEVGAGSGSVARWLGETVGPAGLVAATDVDTRFLRHLGPGVEVRRHDIRTDPLEPGVYDLVHCRSLLMHLADPGAALARMTRALRPDGWLVVENNDYSSFRAVSGHGTRATRWNRAAARMLATAAAHQLFVADLGQRLPGLVAQTGLRVVAAEGRTTVRHGRDPVAQFLTRSLGYLADLDVFAGAGADIEFLLAGLDDPAFEFVDATNFGVSALRPGRNRCP